jgi:hypothetical protein
MASRLKPDKVRSMQANRPIDVWTNGFLRWLSKKLGSQQPHPTVKVLFATEQVWRELFETSQRTTDGSSHEYLGGVKLPHTTKDDPAKAAEILELAAHEAVHLLEILHNKQYMSKRDPMTQWEDVQVARWVKEYADEKGPPF